MKDYKDLESNRRPTGEAGPSAAAAGSRVQTVQIDANADGQRLDNFLLGRLKGAPRSLVYRLLRSGQVRVNSGRARPDTRLAVGDRVRIPPVRLAADAPPRAVPETLLVRIANAIVHEDDQVLVLDKPSGIAVHGGSGIGHGVIEVMRELRGERGGRLELAHRLDRDTSGILVLAKSRRALLALQAQLREGTAEKHYLALLDGRLQPSPFRVEAPLRKQVLQGGERMVRVDPQGKPAASVFTAAERLPGATLAQIVIETGRTHQIRVHAQHIRHAIAGDERYGDAGFNARMKQLGLRRLFLHASGLRIAGPDGEDYLFHAALPEDLSAPLARLAD